MIKDYNVVISKDGPSLSRRGFGTLVILSHETESDYTLIRNEQSIEDLEAPELIRVYRAMKSTYNPEKVAFIGTKEKDIDKVLRSIEKKDFFLFTTTGEAEDALTCLKAVNTIDKIFMYTVRNKEDISVLKDAYKVTNNAYLMYHKDGLPAENLMTMMSIDLSRRNPKDTNLRGVVPHQLSEEELDALEGTNIATYEEIMGVGVVRSSKVGNGEYLDNIIGEYFTIVAVEEGVFDVRLKNMKIGYNNTGIGLLVSGVRNGMDRAKEIQFIEDYVVDYKRRDEVPADEVEAREYNHLHVTAQYQGAIEGGTIRINLTYEGVE